MDNEAAMMMMMSQQLLTLSEVTVTVEHVQHVQV